MICTSCGGSGVKKDGTKCDKCVLLKKTVSDKELRVLPENFREYNYIRGMYPEVDKILSNHNKKRNHIIKYNSKNQDKLMILITALLKQSLSEGKVVLPLISQLHLAKVVKCLYYSIKFDYGSGNIEVDDELISQSDLLLVRLNTKLNQNEEHDIIKIIDYRNTIGKSVTVFANSDIFIPSIKEPLISEL